MSLNESTEMYLESIYILLLSKSDVRSIDVAEYMNYSKPSVSRAVGILKEQGYIDVDGNGYISLTSEGKIAGDKIFERHTILTEILKDLGVEEQSAVDNACRIEHVITDEAFNAIKEHYKKIN